MIPYAKLGLGALLIAGAVWFGTEWQRGRDAIANVEASAQQIEALQDSMRAAVAQIERDREAYRLAVEEMNALTQTFDTITAGLVHASQESEIRFRALQADMRAALSGRPDLAGVHVGLDVLRAWREANAGNTAGSEAAGAAAAGPGASASAVPVGAPAADRRRAPDAATESH